MSNAFNTFIEAKARMQLNRPKRSEAELVKIAHEELRKARVSSNVKGVPLPVNVVPSISKNWTDIARMSVQFEEGKAIAGLAFMSLQSVLRYYPEGAARGIIRHEIAHYKDAVVGGKLRTRGKHCGGWA